LALVDSHILTQQNHTHAPAVRENGATADTPTIASRNRRVLAVDEERGLVVVAGFADFSRASASKTSVAGVSSPQQAHPSSRELFQIIKIDGGKIIAIEAVSVDQPYLMPSIWMNR
jgi:hypothetical protein